jgi:2-polyprenyl-3-methyl-5-hydroxy-6-metoxy-1,4-benzoquinol methylase
MQQGNGTMSTSTAILPDFARKAAHSMRCPNCGGMGMERFYHVDGVPVHSLNLVPDVERALKYPRGVLDLGCCHRCGFIANTAFSDAIKQGVESYEESQGFSPTFVAFAKRISERLVRDYKLGDKTVLEIGCGKGEFLAAMVEQGAGRGVGIDPAFVPGRLESSARDRLEFHAELYDANSPDYKADFIMCRHTLEHIPDTLDFLTMIRKHIGDRPNVHLFIDVPEVSRILREGAYWDIFHEHCSYFSRPSLEVLFRRAGFEMVETWLDFNNQYLLMVGRATGVTTDDRAETKRDIDSIVQGAHTFESVTGPTIRRWHDTIYRGAAAGTRIAIWGSGSKCVGFLSVLGAPTTAEIGCVVDINPHRHGQYMPGLHQQIVAPSELVNYNPDLVIIMNPIYIDEITKNLNTMGLHPEVVAA